MTKTRERTTISVRLTGELSDQVEAYREKMARDLPASEPSTADAVRVLIARGLRAAAGGGGK